VNPATIPAGHPRISVITSSAIASLVNMVAAIASSCPAAAESVFASHLS
jgi:hypothetical protein